MLVEAEMAAYTAIFMFHTRKEKNHEIEGSTDLTSNEHAYNNNNKICISMQGTNYDILIFKYRSINYIIPCMHAKS